jgi:hypothetical protein
LLVLVALLAVIVAAAGSFSLTAATNGRPDAGWNDGQRNCPHNVPSGES